MGSDDLYYNFCTWDNTPPKNSHNEDTVVKILCMITATMSIISVIFYFFRERPNVNQLPRPSDILSKNFQFILLGDFLNCIQILPACIYTVFDSDGYFVYSSKDNLAFGYFLCYLQGYVQMVGILLIFICQAQFMQLYWYIQIYQETKWNLGLKQQWLYLFLPASLLSILPFISRNTHAMSEDGLLRAQNKYLFQPLYGNVEPYLTGHCYLCHNQGGDVYRIFFEIIPFFVTVTIYFNNLRRLFYQNHQNAPQQNEPQNKNTGFKLYIIFLLVYMVCWLPLIIVRMTEIFYPNTQDLFQGPFKTFASISLALVYLNGFSNLLFYWNFVRVEVDSSEGDQQLMDD